MPRQTIQRIVETRGAGLHSGVTTDLRLEPGQAGQGIVFERRDRPGSPRIPAALARVAATERRTSLALDGLDVHTVEHLLAACWALGIDDLTVTLDGPEVPILDGSFAPFVALLDAAGRQFRAGHRRIAWLVDCVEISAGVARYRAEPHQQLDLQVTLEYPEPVIGRQTLALPVTAETFRRELQAARTYGFEEELAGLRNRGLLAGASLGAGLLLDRTSVRNGPLHWPDEFVRHKAGDLLGDLALLQAGLRARVTADRPSHHGNVALAQAIAAVARFSEEA
jgi:UDP-3-O-acyl N-acetylglucosamine deacetylase